MSTGTWFDRQRSVGVVGEQRVMDVFLKAGIAARWKNALSRRDLEVWFPGGTELIEVKNEDKFEQSLNLCVELFQGLREQKLSGILTSESTVYVHTFGEQCIAYRTQMMRNHIAVGEKSGLYIRQPFGKSDNGNGGVLVPQMIIALKPWGEMLPIEKLPGSRVFQPLVP